MDTCVPQPARIWVTRISGVVIGLLFLWLVAMLILAVWARPKILAAFLRNRRPDSPECALGAKSGMRTAEG